MVYLKSGIKRMQSSLSISGRLTKSERLRLKTQQAQRDAAYIRGGVDFSRIQIDDLLVKCADGLVEFEALGPYMTDYSADGYVLSPQVLTPEDQIGLRLNQLFRQLFPLARAVSLYDDYNKTHATEDDGTVSAVFAPADRQMFRTSLERLFVGSGVATGDDDLLLLPESSKVTQAKQLVAELDRFGLIQRRGLEIIFTPRDPENPLYDQITLRTKRGKWLCAALDAAGFLDEQNRRITHLVALPSYMKEQQDKVWEILRVLGISSDKYHNIFYEPQLQPELVTVEVARMLER